MRDLVQLVGALLVIAGAVVLTGSGWPLVAGGLVLLAAVEVPGLARAAVLRREVQRLQAPPAPNAGVPT